MTINSGTAAGMFDSSFSHLNSMQKQAVTASDGALLLLAGAGSGKTTVLMNRIANLLVNCAVRPYEIIAITFTNKAAGEMKQRLQNMDIPGAGDVWASTFHSACARMLRRDIDKLGYDRSFAIYDTSDCASLMKRILKQQEISDKNFPPKMVLGYISRAKDDMVTAGEFLQTAQKQADPRRRIIGEAYVEYEQHLKSANALDFDDLLLLTVRLLDNCPDVLQHYQNRFRYVLVDEYQDTNNLQYRLTAALAGGHGNICVVGDDDQSIYKFRGATIENILNFEKNFPNVRIIRLEQNYRSTGAILAAANDVISNNKGRKGKNLWTENTHGEKPVLCIVSNEREEARYVADEIMQSVKDGRRWQDHVILYRMNAQSNQFETEFKRCAIPYRVYGGTGFYERAEVKDMLAYLCIIHNPDDDVRLLRIINNPARSLGDTTIAKLLAIAQELGVSAYEAIKHAHNYENMLSAVPKLNKFMDMIEDLRQTAATSPLDVLYDELLLKTGYIRMLEKKGTDENISRIENVRELKTNIIAFINEEDGTLFDFLSQTALYTDLDRDDTGTDRVMMMTMHSAKGLEFDTVFIAGAEEGIFPGMRSIGDAAEMEEERRLCYVAMTRAERRLCFTSARQRMIFGKTANSRPSRFTDEISSNNLTTKDLSEPAWMEPDFFSADRYSIPSRPREQYTAGKPRTAVITKNKVPVKYGYGEPAVQNYNAGDIVEHKAFGRGEIKSITPAGNDALLVIDFEKSGEKRLLQNAAAKFMAISH